MAQYRLYCINETGRFFRCDELDAADDEAAISHGRELRGDHPAELWCGARLVTSLSRQAVGAEAAAAPSRA